MKIAPRAGTRPAPPALLPAEPLWKRVPTRDAEGRALSDFMMIIPRLRQRRREEIAAVTDRIEAVLRRYGKAVVFADLNLSLNLLWVTVRPVPGICLELPAAIKVYVPEALLVAERLRRG